MESRRERARHYVLSGLIADLGGVSVLDVGCGCGTIVQFLPQRVSYEGIDISPEAIDSAQKAYSRIPSCAFGVASFECYA